MFSKKKIVRSTSDYWDDLKSLKNALEEVNAVVIGAGAGTLC